jgi:hypothetical protein
MAGLVPAIRSGSLPRRMAGTRPAMQWKLNLIETQNAEWRDLYETLFA